jgi:hypothetical protein
MDKQLSHWNGVPCTIASTDTDPCVFCRGDSVLVVSHQAVPACLRHYGAAWLTVCWLSKLPIIR